MDWSSRWELFTGRGKFLRKSIKAAFVRSPRECCLCGYKGSFVHSGTPAVMDALCPKCRSKPRQRLLKLAVDELHLIPKASSILHFAAETSLRPLIDSLQPGRYVRADLDPRRGDIVLNIERMDLPDESFDCVVCSHVLEHVDDRRALAELFRILRPGGVLVAMVPIVEGWDVTYEDDRLVSRSDRKEHFGGQTHIRYYGRDFRDRLNGGGFEVSEYVSTPQAVSRYGLIRGERVFFARRPVNA